MDYLRKYQSLLTYEGIIFTLIFTLLFGLSHLIMIDFSSIQTVIVSETPFFIVIFTAILAYLFRNSEITFTKVKTVFYITWILFTLSIVISSIAAGDFSWTRATVFVFISLIFLYKIPMELVTFMLVGALISSFVLMAGTIESGASVSVTLILIAGLILIPKSNKVFFIYVLLSSALFITIPFNSATFITLAAIFIAQLVIINAAAIMNNYINPLIVLLTGVLIFTANLLFSRQSATDYFSTAAENTNMMTLIFFIILVIFTAVISVPFSEVVNISLYFIACASLFIFEYEAFTNHMIFTPIVMLILLLSIILSNEQKDDFAYY